MICVHVKRFDFFYWSGIKQAETLIFMLTSLFLSFYTFVWKYYILVNVRLILYYKFQYKHSKEKYQYFPPSLFVYFNRMCFAVLESERSQWAEQHMHMQFYNKRLWCWMNGKLKKNTNQCFNVSRLNNYHIFFRSFHL